MQNEKGERNVHPTHKSALVHTNSCCNVRVVATQHHPFAHCFPCWCFQLWVAGAEFLLVQWPLHAKMICGCGTASTTRHPASCILPCAPTADRNGTSGHACGGQVPRHHINHSGPGPECGVSGAALPSPGGVGRRGERQQQAETAGHHLGGHPGCHVLITY